MWSVYCGRRRDELTAQKNQIRAEIEARRRPRWYEEYNAERDTWLFGLFDAALERVHERPPQGQGNQDAEVPVHVDVRDAEGPPPVPEQPEQAWTRVMPGERQPRENRGPQLGRRNGRPGTRQQPQRRSGHHQNPQAQGGWVRANPSNRLG